MFLLLTLILTCIVSTSCTIHSPRGTYKSNTYTADSECGSNMGTQNYTIITKDSAPSTDLFNLKIVFNETTLRRTYNFTCSDTFKIILSSIYRTNLIFQTYTTKKGSYKGCSARIN